ncbi:MAG: carbohydrate-binding domain-containing protein [Leptonema sp. (in: bacteria)]
MFNPKNKILIFSIILTFALTFSFCGKKKSGFLLLPELVQGEGGPKISPDNPKTVSEESSTTQQTPTIEVTDDTGTIDTANSNNQGLENNNQGNDNNGGVVYLGPPQQDQEKGDDNQNSGNDNNNTDNKPPINQEPPQSDDKGEDVAQDPIEEVVVNDKPPIAQEPPQTGNEDELSQEEQNEEENVTQEEEKEEVSEIENSDTTNTSDSSEAEDVNNQNCKAKVIKIDTSQGRWYNTTEELLPLPEKNLQVGFKKNENLRQKVFKVKGLHTYWAYQKLLVTVNSNCEGGKYRLILVAKNIHGPLPDWYHFFNVKVVNETTGESLGNMLIRASDKRYYRGKLDIKLAKGENTINVLWTNDAWEPNKYDANIQIKRIFIKKIEDKKIKKILTRIGSNFCDSNGRWFVGINPPSVYTYWQGQTVSYCLKTKEAGKYEILIRAGNAKNGLPLMPEYKEFKLLVAANGKSNYITIPAEQGKYHKGTTTLDLPEGDVVLNVTWLNDRYQPPEYDANVEITRVKIKRVGNASSPISAFLLQNPNVTYKVLIPSTILVIGILGMIFWFKRKENIA